MEFMIRVKMEDRWVPHFIGMLQKMQHLGSAGSSRVVGILADGDGDFRPTFSIMGCGSDIAEPRKDLTKIPCDFLYDAG